MSSRAELVCNGIMPIDQLKDYKGMIEPVGIVCTKISRVQLQEQYSLVFPAHKEVDPTEFLTSYAIMRGFYKDHGRPDDARVARTILKDFCNGKLLYCHPPPHLSDEKRRSFYTSFRVGGGRGECMIHESLWKKGGSGEQMKGSSSSSSVEEKKQQSSSMSKKAQPTSVPDVEEEEEEEDEDDEDEEEENTRNNDSSQSAPRLKMNKTALSYLLREQDDASLHVGKTLLEEKHIAKLAEQGMNPDGTLMTKKQLQRQNQRPRKKKTGKANKLRGVHAPMIPMGEIVGRPQGKSADAANRTGTVHNL